MNESIKKLLDECTQPGFDKPWPLIDYEKFAELIVKDCMTRIKEVGKILQKDFKHTNDDYSTGLNDGLISAVDVLADYIEFSELKQ